MTEACIDCGAPSVFTVDHLGERDLLCASCLDKRYPELRLGMLIEAWIPETIHTGKCPHCGWTEAKLRDTAMLGCPLCYEAFGAENWPKYGIERNHSVWSKTG